MGRLDWDRLRRTRPLDGAEAHVDPDGGVIWRQAEQTLEPFGKRRLKLGVIVRRRREQVAPKETAAPAPKQTAPTSKLVRCPRCGTPIAPRKRLRHAVRCNAPRGRDESPERRAVESDTMTT